MTTEQKHNLDIALLAILTDNIKPSQAVKEIKQAFEYYGASFASPAVSGQGMKWIHPMDKADYPEIDGDDFPKEYIVRFKGDDPRSGWVDIQYMTAEQIREINYPDRWEYLVESESPSTPSGEAEGTDALLQDCITAFKVLETVTKKLKLNIGSSATHNLINRIQSELQKCTCNKDMQGESLIGGYAGCPIHDPNKKNEPEHLIAQVESIPPPVQEGEAVGFAEWCDNNYTRSFDERGKPDGWYTRASWAAKKSTSELYSLFKQRPIIENTV